MSVFNVELKKVVDDSYDIEMGYRLEDQLVEDLETGLLGKIRKFAVITDIQTLCLQNQSHFASSPLNLFFL